MFRTCRTKVVMVRMITHGQDLTIKISSVKKGKHDYDNFAYLPDMTDNEHNVTEI